MYVCAPYLIKEEHYWLFVMSYESLIQISMADYKHNDMVKKSDW